MMEEQLEKVAKAIEKFAKEMAELNATFKPYLEWYKRDQQEREKTPIEELQHDQFCPFCKVYNEDVRSCTTCLRVSDTKPLEPPLKDNFEYNENWKAKEVKS